METVRLQPDITLRLLAGLLNSDTDLKSRTLISTRFLRLSGDGSTVWWSDKGVVNSLSGIKQKPYIN